jgi:acyl carrier protein
MMKDIEARIIQLVNSTIETELNSENMEDDLGQAGMDSIKFISIVVALEEAFEIEYPDECLLITQSNTLTKLVSIVSCALEKKDTEGVAE